jgi:hypothetical protein
LSIDYHKPLIYDLPRELDFTAKFTEYNGLDTLPGAQNVSTGREDQNIASARVALKYTDTTQSLGSVDYERGLVWNLNYDDDISDGGNYPRARGGFGAGVPIGANHSSIWFYGAAGVAGGTSSNPLGSFYLGAFGNNYVDDGEVKRYRDWDSFPGFDIDAITARDFAKELVEWNLPPIRFAEIGKPYLFLGSLRPALFAGVMEVKPPTGAQRTLESVGGQVDLNFTAALRLPMTLSFGAAEGLEDGQPGHTELMVSLKIM